MQRIITILLFSIAITFNLKAEGIEFFKGSWQEALDLAIKNDQVIFVDAYTSWCGPCKRMARNVFPQKSVGEFYNENFISVKLDMEKDKDGPSFARKYAVRSYPTLLFIDGSGTVVHKSIGGKKVEDFVKLGAFVIKKMDKSVNLEKEYKAGKRNPDFIYQYVKALNKAGKPSLKIANEYIKTQDDLSTDFNTKFIFESVTEADSRLFDIMIKHRKNIIPMFGQEKFNQKVIAVTNKTVNKAIEYESTELLKEAKDKINNISNKKRAKLFHLRADKKYYLKTGDVKNYLKSSDKYVKEIAGKDPELLEQLTLEVKEYLSTDKKALKKGETWAKKSYELNPNFQTAFIYSEYLYTNNKSKEALKMAQKGQELVAKEKKNPAIFQQLINKIQLDLEHK